MIVQFGTTSKRVNSTAVPTMTASYNCVLKEGCSVISPVIIIDRKVVGHSYNTAYIADFGRYYWIRDIIYENARQYFYLECDVLATYKSDIGSSTQYVTRSASQNNPAIIDTYYPVTTAIEQRKNSYGDPWQAFYNNGIQGFFAVGIINTTGVVYYALDATEYGNLLDYLMSNQFVIDDTNFTGLDLAVNKQLKLMVNPLSYLTSVVWIPLDFDSTFGYGPFLPVLPGHVTSSTFANLPSGPNITGTVYTIDAALSSIAHPQAATYGTYLNSMGFTQCQFTCPPFGSFQLDPLLVSGDYDVHYEIKVDLDTGIARLRIYTLNTGVTPNAETETLVIATAQLGVSIPVTQIITPGVSAIDLGVKALGMAASIASGNVAGAIAGGLSAVDSYYQANVPRVSVIGSRGASVTQEGTILLEYTFKLIADHDVAGHGQPLCTPVQISTLSGFLMCHQPHIAISGTRAEAEQIEGYLTEGMFYE